MAFRALSPFGRESSLSPQQRATDPFQSFRQEVDRLFEDFFRSTGMAPVGGEGRFIPSIDVSETDDHVRVVAELPGVDEKDIDVELNEDVLTIRGEKKAAREEKEESYHLIERSHGSFTRSIRLPFTVDEEKVDASFENGVLTVTLPKPTEAQQKARKITLRRGEGQEAASPKKGGKQQRAS